MSRRRSLLIPHDDGKPILLDCYDGAYGKTLRIDMQCSDSLDTFNRFLEEFSQGHTNIVSLRSIERVMVVPPLVDVRLLRSDGEGIEAKDEGAGKVIEWSNNPDGWERVIGLLGPLTRHSREGKSGHQYLTPPEARILVELALLE